MLDILMVLAVIPLAAPASQPASLVQTSQPAAVASRPAPLEPLVDETGDARSARQYRSEVAHLYGESDPGFGRDIRLAVNAFHWGRYRTGMGLFSRGLAGLDEASLPRWDDGRMWLTVIRNAVRSLDGSPRAHAEASLDRVRQQSQDKRLFWDLVAASLEMDDDEYEPVLSGVPQKGMSRLALIIQQGKPMVRTFTEHPGREDTEGLAFEAEWQGFVVLAGGVVVIVQPREVDLFTPDGRNWDDPDSRGHSSLGTTRSRK